MNITILAFGKSKTAFHEPAISEYQKRLSRWVAVNWRILPATDTEQESQQIMTLIDKLGPHSIVVLLDERGVAWSTPQLAARFADWQNQSVKEVLFIIGGAHGVSQTVRDRAQAVWSLSNLVFPHELVRVMLIEQIYRAYDINAGGSYHHS